MTPKEKAKELVDNFIPHTRVYHEVLGWEDYIDAAKQCSLITVNEIISLMIKFHGRHISNNLFEIEYWHEVKKEIELL
jgi:hypothetical protein